MDGPSGAPGAGAAVVNGGGRDLETAGVAGPRQPPTTRRGVLLFCPPAVLAAAYLAICVHFHSAWPWNLAIHEDGRHTLWQTVFYFEHALGELPLEWLLGWSVAGAALWYAGETIALPPLRMALAAAVGLDALILTASWREVGAQSSLMWFFQYRTREGERLLYGSHWRYHLMSEAALILLTLAMAAWAGDGGWRARRTTLFWTSVAVFAALTAIFGWSAAPFRDARYLGHEARETLTHGLVTVPLAVSVCLAMAGRPGKARRTPRAAWWAFGGFALLAAYQAVAAALAGSRSQAQSNDLVKVLCVHFFEHALSYLVVAAHAALFYSLAGRRGVRPGGQSAGG
jgi:hypothetical protein